MVAPLPNPYVGPRAFQTGETLYGRDAEVRRLFELLVAERIVLLHSPSGAGKSSLIQAGLIPRLQQEGFRVLPVARVNLERPGELDGGAGRANRYTLSALLSLEEALLPAQRPSLPELAALSLEAYLSSRPERADVAEAETELEVLIFDQFEEILTTAPADREGKLAFFAQLGQALRNPRRWALFAMREDYLGALDPYLRPVPTRLANTFRLDFLGEAAALQAIQKPSRAAGVEFTQSAATRLVDDLRKMQVQQPDGMTVESLGPYVEPVQLQVVCYRLWESLPPDCKDIQPADLAGVGDVDQSLADYYSTSVAAAVEKTGPGERRVREWFETALISGGVRGQVRMGPSQSGGLDNQAIASLVNAHLVRAEKRAGSTWYELAHDRLIEPIHKDNAAWFRAHLSLLQRQAALWDEHDRPEGFLLQGQALEQAERWVAGQLDVPLKDLSRLLGDPQKNLAEKALTPEEIDFLKACQAARLRRKRERNRLISLAVLLALTLVMAAGAVYFWNVASSSAARMAKLAQENAWIAETSLANEQIAVSQRYAAATAEAEAVHLRSTAIAERILAEDARAEAERQADIARAGQLAALSQAALLDKPQQGLLFAVEAYRLAEQAGGGAILPAREALLGALQTTGGRGLAGHADSILALAYSPDGRWLATGSVDATARLWDMEQSAQDPGAAPLILSGHTGSVTALAFSPDGRWLASGAGSDEAARVWEIQQLEKNPGAAPFVLGGHKEWVSALAFSPDGRWLASGSEDGTARLWDMQQLAQDGRAAPLVLGRFDYMVLALAFSPDGRWLAAGGRGFTAFMWDLSKTSQDLDPAPLLLHGHFGSVYTLAFSPDGRWLAIGSGDSAARLWEVPKLAQDPDAEPVVLRGHAFMIYTLAFSPDGRWLATGSADNTTGLWEVPKLAQDPDPEPLFLRGHAGPVYTLAFSPDGHWLATGSGDKTARLWDVERLAQDPGAIPLVLRGHEDRISSLAFSPDGRWLATGSGDKTARLWDLQVLAQDPWAFPVILRGHADPIYTLAFSPDGRWLATGSDDMTDRLWDLQRLALDHGAAPIVLAGHENSIYKLAFSPDGRWLATASADKTARLWDVPQLVQDSSAPPRVLRGHEDWISSLAFSPDGRWLATGSDDYTARLWDVAQLLQDPGAAPIVLRGHEDTLSTLAFSPDGRWLATGSYDGTTRLWDVSQTAQDVERTPRVLRGHEGLISTLAFSPDGQWLATGSGDMMARLWDLQQLAQDPGAAPLVLRGHAELLTTLAFSPDGRWLATGSIDQTARLWLIDPEAQMALACRTAGRNLSEAEWGQYFSADPYQKTCPELP